MLLVFDSFSKTCIFFQIINLKHVHLLIHENLAYKTAACYSDIHFWVFYS